MLKDRAATQRASIEHEFQIGKKSVTRNLLFRRKLARHGRFDFLSRVRQRGRQVDQLALGEIHTMSSMRTPSFSSGM